MITQSQIDALKWFHDFEFPGGLHARSNDKRSRAFHTLFWSLIEEKPKTIDFRGKSVVDVGTWDGYFSFLAEEPGARGVPAVDDYT